MKFPFGSRTVPAIVPTDSFWLCAGTGASTELAGCDCARTLGASRAYTLLHVQIRAALPFILTGMRLAMAGAWSSIVAVEMIAATSGLGYMIMQAGDYLDTALAFAGIITIAIIALIIDAGLRGLLLLADPSRRG